MKGIILSGGKGTRLYPLTRVLSKQILPVYDKPMIYYPLSMFLLAGIKEILIISSMDHIEFYRNQLGTGEMLGISLTYKVQKEPRGLADAFIIGEEFIGDSDVALILGDNIFYGSNMSQFLDEAQRQISDVGGATVFGYYVRNPKPFGVVEFDKDGKVLSIEEKPENPKSNYIVPGLYFYDNRVVKFAQEVEPSARGEIEITSINQRYLELGELRVKRFGRGVAWFDAGTAAGLLEASNFIAAIQNQQGFYIAAIEEIAYRKGFITKNQLMEIGKELSKSEYGKYLLEIAEEGLD